MCQSRSLSPTALLHSLVSLCSLDHPLLVFWTFPTLPSANPSLDAWTFTPAASKVPLPVSSLRASAFPKTVTGRRSAKTRATTSARTVISELQSFLNVQASRFACHPGRSHRCPCGHGSHDVYFRAPSGLLPPRTSDMLAVRFRAIDGRGLSPHKIRSVVGCIHRFNGFACVRLAKQLKQKTSKGASPECQLILTRAAGFT